jgi:prepilin peptidase CpaA
MNLSLLIHFLTLGAFTALLVAAARSDLKNYRIPNGYSVALLSLYPLFAFTAPHSVAPIASLGVMVAVLAVGFAAFAFGWIGGGDAKLLSTASLFAGPALIGEFLLVMALAGGAMALLTRCRFLRLRFAGPMDDAGSHVAPTTDKLPYGVAIAVGGVFAAVRLAGMAGGSP